MEQRTIATGLAGAAALAAMTAALAFAAKMPASLTGQAASRACAPACNDDGSGCGQTCIDFTDDGPVVIRLECDAMFCEAAQCETAADCPLPICDEACSPRGVRTCPAAECDSGSCIYKTRDEACDAPAASPPPDEAQPAPVPAEERPLTDEEMIELLSGPPAQLRPAPVEETAPVLLTLPAENKQNTPAAEPALSPPTLLELISAAETDNNDCLEGSNGMPECDACLLEFCASDSASVQRFCGFICGPTTLAGETDPFGLQPEDPFGGTQPMAPAAPEEPLGDAQATTEEPQEGNDAEDGATISDNSDPDIIPFDSEPLEEPSSNILVRITRAIRDFFGSLFR